jgi:dihydrofolate synthase / folylpolyglutamate synthase
MADPHAYLTSLKPLAIRLGLERMGRALDALGHPERALRILQVAGTNGKGSTCAMAERALRDAGHRTGLYTSPHLQAFNERIAVDGEAISDDDLDRAVVEIRRACPWHDAADDGERLTYFEFATLLALVHFAECGVGATVLEVGLGGRFDATTAVEPLACAIAPIGLDHVELLGGTIEAIAREKAGIMKRGVPVAVARAQRPEAMAVLVEEARRRGAPLTVAEAAWPGAIALDGAHQAGNAALAAAALRLLDAAGVSVPAESIARGIATARWPGRLERLGGVLLDGAHNADGAAAFAAALAALHPGQKADIVFGVLADKDHGAMLAAVAPVARALHLVAPRSPRARPPGSYRALAERFVASVDEHQSVADAIRCARAGAAGGGVACVAGSLYLVGEARALLGG